MLLNLSPAAFGWTGVQLFLLISGLLIHLGYLKGLSNGRDFDARTFFSNRFWRIYPPYLLTLLFFCFAVHGGRYLTQPDKVADLLTHVFMVHNLTSHTMWSINPSLWSIALEVQLYLIYPLLLMIRARMGMELTLLSTYGIGALILVLNHLGLPGNHDMAYTANVLAYWYIWCSGAFLAERFHQGRSVFPSGNRTLLLSQALFIGMLVAHCFDASKVIVVPLAVMAWSAFFEWSLQVRLPDRLERSAPFRGLVVVGLCSYSIYLIHQPYLRQLLKFFGGYGFEPAALVIKVAVVFVIVFLIAYALYKLVELPSIEQGVRSRERRKARMT